MSPVGRSPLAKDTQTISFRIAPDFSQELCVVVGRLKLERSMFIRVAAEALVEDFEKVEHYTQLAERTRVAPKTKQVSCLLSVAFLDQVAGLVGKGELVTFLRVALSLALDECRGRERVMWPLSFGGGRGETSNQFQSKPRPAAFKPS